MRVRVSVSFCVFACLPTNTGVFRRPEALDSPGAGVIGTVSHQIWILGTELKSSARVVCNLYYQATSLAPMREFLDQII